MTGLGEPGGAGEDARETAGDGSGEVEIGVGGEV